MQLFSDLFKFMNEPIVTLGIVAILFAVFVLIVSFRTFTPSQEVLYFSEAERLCEPLTVKELTPKSIRTKGNKRFFRNAIAFNVKRGRRIVTTWLAKRGTAYTFKLAGTPKGKATKIGTIYEALESIWSKELLDKLAKEYRDPLMISEIFVTVELDTGFTPTGYVAATEEDVFTEANQNMAELVGSRIKEVLQREDWIRNAGLAGIGAAGVLIAQSLGILT